VNDTTSPKNPPTTPVVERIASQGGRFSPWKRDRLLKAAYFAVIAMEDVPSVRTVGAMFKRITGKGMRSDDIRKWLSVEGEALAKKYRDTLGTQLEHTLNTPRDTPIKHKNGQSGHTSGHTLNTLGTPSRADSFTNKNTNKNNYAHTRENRQAQDRTPEENEAVRRAIERAAEQTRRSEEM